MIDLQQMLLPVADHNVQALTAAKVARIPIAALLSLTRERPAIAEALWRDTLLDAAVFREWVLNVGRREGRGRVAHLLCEFATRLATVGLGDVHQFELPMTQEQLGDATGMTSVHVNRILQSLGDEDVIRRNKRSVTVLNWDRLSEIAGFSPDYLHQPSIRNAHV